MFIKGKTYIIAKFHRTDLVICSHSRPGKIQPYSQINMVLSYKVLPYLQPKPMKAKEFILSEKANMQFDQCFGSIHIRRPLFSSLVIYIAFSPALAGFLNN